MIFVLGAKGFLGSAFVRRISAENEQFAAITRENYHDYVGRRCRVLINASGNSRKYLAVREPVQEFQMSVTNVLLTLCDFSPELYVHLSSIDVYNDVSNPSNNRETASIEASGLSPYGFSKYLAEMVARRYAKRYLIARLGGVVGPGLKKNPIYDLLYRGHIYVHPDSLYQYMPTDKVAEIVLDLIRGGNEGEIFNLCGDGLVSPRQVASWLDLQGYSHPDDVKPEHYEINIEKIKGQYHIPTSADSVKAFIESHQAVTSSASEN